MIFTELSENGISDLQIKYYDESRAFRSDRGAMK